jgi:hypothetical protein
MDSTVCRQKECQVRDLVLVQACLPLALVVAFFAVLAGWERFLRRTCPLQDDVPT